MMGGDSGCSRAYIPLRCHCSGLTVNAILPFLCSLSQLSWSSEHIFLFRHSDYRTWLELRLTLVVRVGSIHIHVATLQPLSGELLVFFQRVTCRCVVEAAQTVGCYDLPEVIRNQCEHVSNSQKITTQLSAHLPTAMRKIRLRFE
jgi:hypothetical protein